MESAENANLMNGKRRKEPSGNLRQDIGSRLQLGYIRSEAWAGLLKRFNSFSR